MFEIECPICKKRYPAKVDLCECGFEGLKREPIYGSEEYDIYLRDELFDIYKFAKRVYYGSLPYEKDRVEEDINEGKNYINYVFAARGLSLVDECGVLPVVARNGMMPFTGVSALIVNVDELEPDFLDECSVRVLFIGDRVKELTGGYIGRSSLRYIFVDDDNPRFSQENNVLFNKDKTVLIKYARLRPEIEYTVPRTVKCLARDAFVYPKHLKFLRLPKGVAGTDGLFLESDTKIIYY